MTSDLTHYYTPNPARGYTPYDLPPESYQLTIGNVNAAAATASLTDPLTGQQQPATIVSRNGSQIVVELQATDSPRMLTIQDAPASSVSTTTLITPSPPTDGGGGGATGATPGTTSTAPPSTTTPSSPSPSAAGKPGSTLEATGTGKSGPEVVLRVPARIGVGSAARAGISLLVGCRQLCAVSVTAVPAGARHSQVLARATARVAGEKTVELVLRMSASGRNWLRSLREAALLRITARAAGGSASRAIGVFKAGRNMPHPRRPAGRLGIAVIDWRNLF